MTQPAANRRRVAAGLLCGAVLALGLAGLAGAVARGQAHRDAFRRRATLSLGALTEVVARLGGEGDGVRRAVAEWARTHPDLSAIRVLRGLSLEASTAPADAGAKAAPRRLERDEKGLFDLGQRLRAAVETNRQEGVARKEEIEVAPTAEKGIALAAPVERNGAVSGFVEVETEPAPAGPAVRLRPPLAALVLTLGLFGVAALAIGERRLPLVVVAGVLLAAALVGLGRVTLAGLADERHAVEASLAARLLHEKASAESLLASLGAPATLDAARWDEDVFRRPRGLISASGAVDRARVESALALGAARLTQVWAASGLLGLAVLCFVAFGLAARVTGALKRYRAAYAYVTPALVGMLVLVFLPFFYGILLGFTEQTVYNTEKPITEIWAGLRNFKEILGDFHVTQVTPEGHAVNYQNFYWTLFFTVVWTVSNVSFGVSMGLFLALILNTKGLRMRAIYRVIFVLPWAMPNYITALIWKGMFHQQFGVVNQMLQMIGAKPVSWFEHTWTSFAAVLATNGWLSVPFMMVISLGALQSIPADLYEAARVDGASRWQQFRSITLPSLKPALVPAIILSVIWTFNQFNIIYLVSGGEPSHSTEILITQAYKFAFEQYRYGYAAAYSTVIFAILLLYGTWQNRVTKATEGI